MNQNDSVQEASPREVDGWLRAGEAVLIDVREPDEHAHEWIENSKLLPLSRFDARQAAADAKPGQRIVFHCRGGRRSKDAARLGASLADSGFVVVSMAGGIDGWKKENFPVLMNPTVSGISVMRQVQLVIGLGVLSGSALAWFVHPAFVAVPAFFGAGLVFAGASGTCGLAAVIGMMPWNRLPRGAGSCATGQCG